MITDAAFAPCARSDILDVRFGRGALLYEMADRRLHTLNASAVMVWRRLDGLTTLCDIARSVSDTFAADRSVVQGDVAAVVARFEEVGLLITSDEAALAARSAIAAESGEVESVERPVQLLEQLDALEWASVSPVYRAVGLMFRVRSEDVDVATELGRVLRSLSTTRGDGDTDHVYSIRARVHEGVAQWRVYFDGKAIKTVVSSDAAVALVLWHIDEAVVTHSPDALFFHGAAVQFGERVVMFPGPMNSGTSTLTTALVRRGLPYLSNGEVALDVSVGAAVPFPKAISLDGATRVFFPELFPDEPTGTAELAPGRWHIDPAAIAGATLGTGGRVALVISPHYLAGASTRLERVTDVDAVRLLLDNSYEFARLGNRAFDALVTVAQESVVFRLEYSELDAACEVVLQLAREIR
ncbi:unannotated protein [freshwater metagenome]|uniref:Unannotated protein n=1 Tax=freshwater metagenome TaxID=449393 RepID=A0A6J6RN94_9ZZZZ|nr:PqqD family peptide modification chaperone [Actinomycetota bacterium]